MSTLSVLVFPQETEAERFPGTLKSLQHQHLTPLPYQKREASHLSTRAMVISCGETYFECL